MRRAVRLTISAPTEWRSISSEQASPIRVLVEFVLPMALIPTLAWCIGLALSGDTSYSNSSRIVHRGAIVYAGSLISVVALAACIYVLTPLFEIARDWAGAFRLAAYSSAPVMLVGVVLLIPDLAFGTLLGAFQSFYLLYAGFRQVLAVKEDQAAEFVALVVVALSVVLILAGAAGSAAGIL